MKEVIKIDNQVSNKLESLHYDINTMQDLLAYMMEQNININSDVGLNYQTELKQKKKLYNEAKQEVTEKFIPEQYKTPEYYWEMDFKNSSLIIRRKDGTSSI